MALTVDEIVKIFSLLISTVAGFLAYRQYRNNVMWNRRKYAAESIRAIFEKPKVMFVMSILDWPDKEVTIDSEMAKIAGSEKMTIDQHRLSLILSKNILPYSPINYHIRDCFDEFIRNIEWMYSFRELGIMEWADFSPYFGYWCELLNYNRHVKTSVLDAFWGYCAAFHNEKAVRLFVEEVSRVHAASRGK